MRAIAYLAEPDGDEYKYLDLKRYFHDLALTWGFDKALCVDASETDYVTPASGTEVYASWFELETAYTLAKYVLLTPDGGTDLADFDEPAGDVIYVLGGDYTSVHNWQGTPDAMVTIPTALAPGVGAWSFLAMAVVANKVYAP